MRFPAQKSAAMIERELLRAHGPAIGGSELRALLGYKTGGAFRQAAYCKRLPVPTFFIEGRKGRHAKVEDVACWLASLGAGNPAPGKKEAKPE